MPFPFDRPGLARTLLCVLLIIELTSQTIWNLPNTKSGRRRAPYPQTLKTCRQIIFFFIRMGGYFSIYISQSAYSTYTFKKRRAYTIRKTFIDALFFLEQNWTQLKHKNNQQAYTSGAIESHEINQPIRASDLR